MIVLLVHVHTVHYVLIQKMDLVAYAPLGKISVLTVRDGVNCIKIWLFTLKLLLAYNVGCSCKNGGRCVMGLGTYICECPYGYNGLSCETSECLEKK